MNSEIEKNHIILTIGIPTYNGAETIAFALDHILANVNTNNQSFLEILISNNASADATEKVLAPYLKKYSALISYYKNDNNIGFDRNVNAIMSNAKGAFVWLHSDNDYLLSKSAIDKVLDIISEYPEVACILANYDNGQQLKCTEDTLCLRGEDFFWKSSFKIGFMSSNIINKLLWQQLNLIPYEGTGWIHFGYQIEALQSNQAFIIKDELIKSLDRAQAWGGKGSFVLFGLRLGKLIKNMKKLGYSRKLCFELENVGRGIRWYGIPISIPWAKALGLKIDFNIFIDMCKTFGNHWSFWFFEFWFLLIPSPIFVWLRQIYKFFKNVLK